MEQAYRRNQVRRARIARNQKWNISSAKELFEMKLNMGKEVISNMPCSILIIFSVCADCLLCFFLIHTRRFTEIDWDTYMQQAGRFLNGERNYSYISGDSGPCVYPAGHLYAYGFLYKVTARGSDLLMAQYMFCALYLLNLALVSLIHLKLAIAPVWTLLFVCFTSYRVHSIFVLRLFNDTIAMTLAHLAILLIFHEKWTLSSIVYSLALSVKMNLLFFLPALGAVLTVVSGYVGAFCHCVLILLIQVILGLPFLMECPQSYLSASFNFGRQFLYEWTVNWKFLSPDLFGNKYFHLALLTLHLSCLILFGFKYWFRSKGGLWHLLLKNSNSVTNFLLAQKADLDPFDIAYSFFTANFIGMIFSRSLHFQFYSWYYYSLPTLLWMTDYRTTYKLCLWALIEASWNCFPSTAGSSILLLVCHLTLLYGLMDRGDQKRTSVRTEKKNI